MMINFSTLFEKWVSKSVATSSPTIKVGLLVATPQFGLVGLVNQASTRTQNSMAGGWEPYNKLNPSRRLKSLDYPHFTRMDIWRLMSLFSISVLTIQTANLVVPRLLRFVPILGNMHQQYSDH